ncbi:MAG: hypothetical protein WD184_04190 [Acidimicrobiia bacterium]
MTIRNPFKLVATDDGPWYEILLPESDGAVVLQSDQVQTLIAIHDFRGPADVLNHEPGHVSGPVVMRFPGVFMPPQGTVIQVSEPNRDVIVSDVRLQIDAAGLAAIVYVTDSRED